MALDLYGASSGERPTLSAIASRVGLTEAGVLHYFGSMDELFVAILEARDEHAVDAGELDGPEQVWAYLSQTTRTPGLTRLFVDMSVAAADPNHPAHAFMALHRQRVTDIVRRALEVEDDRAIRLAVAAAEGLQMRWLQDPTTDIVGDLAALTDALGGSSMRREKVLRERGDGLETQ